MSDRVHLPAPDREHWPLAIAALTVLVGAGLLLFALLRGGGDADAQPPPQPTIPVAAVAATAPQPSPAEAAAATATTADKGGQERPTGRRDKASAKQTGDGDNVFQRPVPASYVAGFYPVYAEAQRAFGVNWLLIAAVHRQETAFSTHPTTYRGLNSAGCCGGPMQFNVTNGDSKGRGSTWDRYRNSYKAGRRPQRYPSMRRKHPSLYDDFDAIMAAAALLRDNGAGPKLDATAWRAAYDYYGHDLTGISYASQVAGRAIGWARGGFCAACADRETIVARVDAAWGAPVRNEMVAAERAAAAAAAAQTKQHKSGRRSSGRRR